MWFCFLQEIYVKLTISKDSLYFSCVYASLRIHRQVENLVIFDSNFINKLTAWILQLF